MKPAKQVRDKTGQDDGRTIASMDVDGMPWVTRRPALFPRRKTVSRDGSEGQVPEEPMSRKETWHLMLNAVFAALVIGLIFLAGIFLFLMFSLHVWLR